MADPKDILKLIFILIVVEGLVLSLWHRSQRSTGVLIGTIANLISGGSLIAATYVALSSGSSFIILTLITLAGVAHIVDLFERIRSL